MRSEEYELGQLTANVRNLTIAVDTLTKRLDTFGVELEGIKLFRAKVVGMSLVASVLASAALTITVEVLHSWAR